MQANTHSLPGRQLGLWFAGVAIITLLTLIGYPHYQYYIDPDGIAYLTIAQRYANGDFMRAINGYWSPFSCWLTAVAMQTGIGAIPASVAVNTIGGIALWSVSLSLWRLTAMPQMYQTACGLGFCLFICHAIYFQSFADLWGCFFLLLHLRLLLRTQFTRHWYFPLLLGGFSGLAYWAKAYCLPYSLIFTAIAFVVVYKNATQKMIRASLLYLGSLGILAGVWVALLYYKYGFLATGTAGMLNVSWYLAGHPYYAQHVNTMLPPPYHNSPYYWEDAWTVNGYPPHFWDSGYFLMRQLRRLGINAVLYIWSGIQLFLFYPAVVYLSGMGLWHKKHRAELTDRQKLFYITLLLFPLGYFPINFEARYLWTTLPVALAVLPNMVGQIKAIPARMAMAMPYMVMVLLMAFPCYRLYAMYNKGKDDKLLAEKLSAYNIHAFTGNATEGKMGRIAYFLGKPYYTIRKDKPINNEELLKDVHRYGIDCFIDYKPRKAPKAPIPTILHKNKDKLIFQALTDDGDTLRVWQFL